MRLTLARVRKATRSALEQHGINGEVMDAKWLGQKSRPKFGNGPQFRVASIIVRFNGITMKKFVTLEDNGGWVVK